MNEKPKTTLGPKTERAKDVVGAVIMYAFGLSIAGLMLGLVAWVIAGLL